jgi:hypothetical protein
LEETIIVDPPHPPGNNAARAPNPINSRATRQKVPFIRPSMA